MLRLQSPQINGLEACDFSLPILKLILQNNSKSVCIFLLSDKIISCPKNLSWKHVRLFIMVIVPGHFIIRVNKKKIIIIMKLLNTITSVIISLIPLSLLSFYYSTASTEGILPSTSLNSLEPSCSYLTVHVMPRWLMFIEQTGQHFIYLIFQAWRKMVKKHAFTIFTL